ncbi:phosphotransferase [Nonomuraea wenchangensis]|uniref:phosphotransferase n=1 Tax=Nonomuraea wenchangensis TaxID=568860 RepID=UPI0037152558
MNTVEQSVTANGRLQPTPQWLENVLRERGLDVEITALSTSKVGNGLMATTERLEVAYAHPTDAPTTFILKQTGPGEMSRRTGRRGYGFPGRPGFYATEVLFYRHVAPATSIRRPECWWSHLSAEGDEFALLLEDIKGRPGDEQQGCTVSEAHLVMSNLARLHAPYWNAADTALGGRITDDEAASYKRKMARNIEAVLGAVSGPLWEEAAPVIERFGEAADAWLLASSRPLTLVHCDFRLDNMLFTPGQGDQTCATVDWQTVLPGSPGRDLGLVLGASMPAAMASDHLPQLLGTYRARLRELGVTDYSADDCYDDFRWGLFHGLHNVLTISRAVDMNERGAYLMEHWLSRTCRAISEHHALRVLPCNDA